MKKIRKKRKTREIDGANLAQQIEDVKTEHGLAGYRLFPSPDGVVHLGASVEDDCVDVWLPWDIYREAMAKRVEHPEKVEEPEPSEPRMVNESKGEIFEPENNEEADGQ